MNIQRISNSTNTLQKNHHAQERQSVNLTLIEKQLSNSTKESDEREYRIYNLAESLISWVQGKSLNNLQKAILKGAYQDKTYEEMAEDINCSEGHIKDVAADLWKQLSEKLGEKVGKKNFKSLLERQLNANNVLNPQTNYQPQTADYTNKSWGNIPDTSIFYGRKQELLTLEKWIIEDHCRLITLSGMFGIGKSALAAKLTKQVQDRFDFVIWRSLIDVSQGEDIFTSILKLFNPCEEIDASMSLEHKLLSVIEFFRTHRCLVILDNAELIFECSKSNQQCSLECLTYQQLIKCIGMTEHQSCLILTSQYKSKELDIEEGINLPVRSLQLKGLSVEEIQEILHAIEPFWATPQDWSFLVEYYAGNPLMLKVLAVHTRELFECNISKFLEIETHQTLILIALRDWLDKQFDSLSNLEKLIMRELALSQAPLKISDLQKKTFLPSSEEHFIEALINLIQSSLVEKSSFGFKLEPVIMDYVNSRI
ncbi:MAG: hypothetical protein KI793_35270 [Rivularia sp. (in: Bacteria)]|nr:hypothetical protein [Rivularia sp. MS3]